MRKHIFLFPLLFLIVLPVFAQKRRIPVKAAPKKQIVVPATTAAAPVVTEIPAKDWDAITDALDKENWALGATLSAIALDKLKSDNEKQQLAQLRYFYVYATEGKVAEGKTSYAEFEKIIENFIGREFVMPKRTILADCTGRVNYICAEKDDDQVLRVTAADKSATIHSFEYVKLSEKFDTKFNDGKSASLAAILESAEPFTGKSNMKIVRLTFAAGLVTILPG